MQSSHSFNVTSVKVITANILELKKKSGKKKNLSSTLFIIWSIERKTIAMSVSTKD